MQKKCMLHLLHIMFMEKELNLLEKEFSQDLMNLVEERARFVSFCIEQYAKVKNMPTEDVVNIFEKYDITEHFCEFFDVLHTHGHNWLIEEIDEMINDRKK